MRNLILLLCCGVALACASEPKAPASSRLQFVDSQMFDDQLRESLAADLNEITVAFSGKDVTVNEIPDRLDSWLYTISKRDGGKVEVLPDPALPATRNPLALAGAALSLGMGGFKLVQEQIHYFPARQYNAFVYHDPSTGVLTRVVFARLPQN